MQTELATVIHEGSAAWGKVKITVDGNKDIIAVAIDETLIEKSQKSKIEEAVKEAYKDATGMAFQMKLSKKMQEMGGMDLFKSLKT